MHRGLCLWSSVLLVLHVLYARSLPCSIREELTDVRLAKILYTVHNQS